MRHHRVVLERLPSMQVVHVDDLDDVIAQQTGLLAAAQARWRTVNAPHLVALVRAGALFINGKLVERPDENAPPTAV